MGTSRPWSILEDRFVEITEKTFTATGTHAETRRWDYTVPAGRVVYALASVQVSWENDGTVSNGSMYGLIGALRSELTSGVRLLVRGIPRGSNDQTVGGEALLVGPFYPGNFFFGETRIADTAGAPPVRFVLVRAMFFEYRR